LRHGQVELVGDKSAVMNDDFRPDEDVLDEDVGGRWPWKNETRPPI
jgi:hypothetical protein